MRLGGINYYDGVPFQGPVFNPRAPEPHPADIGRTLRWFWSVVLFCVLVFASALYLRDRPDRDALPSNVPPPVSSRTEYDPILKRNFVQTEAPAPIKLPGKITRPESYGNKPTP